MESESRLVVIVGRPGGTARIDQKDPSQGKDVRYVYFRPVGKDSWERHKSGTFDTAKPFTLEPGRYHLYLEGLHRPVLTPPCPVQIMKMEAMENDPGPEDSWPPPGIVGLWP